MVYNTPVTWSWVARAGVDGIFSATRSVHRGSTSLRALFAALERAGFVLKRSWPDQRLGVGAADEGIYGPVDGGISGALDGRGPTCGGRCVSELVSVLCVLAMGERMDMFTVETVLFPAMQSYYPSCQGPPERRRPPQNVLGRYKVLARTGISS